MKMDFEKNIISDGYGTWNIVEKRNDCYIAQGFGNIREGISAYEIGFRNQHISVMRLLPHHFYDLCLAMIGVIKHLTDDTQIPQELRQIKKIFLEHPSMKHTYNKDK